MPASFTSEESVSRSGRAPSSLSTHHPSTTSTAASSRATSPLPIGTNKTKRRPSVTRYHTTAGGSLSPPRNHTLEAAILSRVLAEEDRVIATEGAGFETCDRGAGPDPGARECLRTYLKRGQRRVETHQTYFAEATAWKNAESETPQAQEETRVQTLLGITRSGVTGSNPEIEHLRAEKAEAGGGAGGARVVMELQQAMGADKAREVELAEGRAGIIDNEE